MNMTRWHPNYPATGNRNMSDNPFELFDSWEDFLSHYVTDKNEIIRRGGPGDAIQKGEWYLSSADAIITSQIPTQWNDTDGWFLSYVSLNSPSGASNEYIEFVKLFRDTPAEPNGREPWKWQWDSGDKDAWGSLKYHYKVDFDQLKMSWDFINWNDNPFISFK